ncbi:MAG: flavin reductase family protein [Planctomycetota bacterium]|jgi:flavin reductase (DIM6/NTAB) family NADH-FMN oxidoreductase RutF
MKKQVELNKAKWLVEPGCVVLVTSGTMENANVMTFSWQTPVNSAEPCLILLAISHIRYSYELIKQNKELVINVPGRELLEQTHFVGQITGRGIDKFKESGLTPIPAKMVQPPLIEQCAAHLECRVVEIFKMQTHDLLVCEVVRVVCEVVRVEADADFFDGRWIPEKFHTLHYLTGNKYGLMESTIEASEKKPQNK